jgi:hypothetical protein
MAGVAWRVAADGSGVALAALLVPTVFGAIVRTGPSSARSPPPARHAR